VVRTGRAWRGWISLVQLLLVEGQALPFPTGGRDRPRYADILEASASTSEPTGGRQIEVARDCRPDLGGEVEEGKGYLGRFLLDPTHLELVDREACGIGSSITFGLIYHIGW